MKKIEFSSQQFSVPSSIRCSSRIDASIVLLIDLMVNGVSMRLCYPPAGPYPDHLRTLSSYSFLVLLILHTQCVTVDFIEGSLLADTSTLTFYLLALSQLN